MNNGTLIGLDWGTSNVRAALLNSDGLVLDQRQAKSGIGAFAPGQFADQFDELVSGWPIVPSIAAGMVGSKQGWVEADYLACPAGSEELAGSLAPAKHGDRTVFIVPGLKIEKNGRYNVMRGEETQLAGLMRSNSSFSGTVIMPGTHSKWVQITDGAVAGFHTYMTGEMFHTICEHTILKHSVSQDGGDEAHFENKVKSLTESQSSVEGELFEIRARQLLVDTDRGQLREELSAILIMSEIQAGLKDGYLEDRKTVLVGADELISRYAFAFQTQGVRSSKADGTGLVWQALTDIATKANLVERK